MSAAQHTPGRFKVTFFNQLANRRGTAVDDLSREEADSVAAQVNDKNKPFFYLQDVRVEEDSKTTGSAS